MTPSPPSHGTLRLPAPWGWLQIDWQQHTIIASELHPGPPLALPEAEPSTPFAAQIWQQWQGYLSDPHHPITLPLHHHGTPYQQRVWQLLRTIPPGQTRSYGDLAAHLASSPRAIGNACRANPLPWLIPCHRITARHHLGGYHGASSGPQLAIKRWLLEHEGALPTSD